MHWLETAQLLFNGHFSQSSIDVQMKTKSTSPDSYDWNYRELATLLTPCSLHRIYLAWTKDYQLSFYCLLAFIRREVYMDSTLVLPLRESLVMSGTQIGANAVSHLLDTDLYPNPILMYGTSF